MALFQLIKGTLAGSFVVGRVLLEGLGNALEVRGADTGGLLPIAAGPPASGEHLVTRDYADATYGGRDGRIREIQLPLGRKSSRSAALLPAGACVTGVEVVIYDPYPPGAGLSLGVDGYAEALLRGGVANLGELDRVQRWTGRNHRSSDSPVKARITGSPETGSGMAYITFSLPMQ